MTIQFPVVENTLKWNKVYLCDVRRGEKKKTLKIKTENNKTFYDKNIDTKTCSSPIMDICINFNFCRSTRCSDGSFNNII